MDGKQQDIVPADIWEKVGMYLMLMGESVRVLVNLMETSKYIKDAISLSNNLWEQYYRRDFASDFQCVHFENYTKFAKEVNCPFNDLGAWDVLVASMRDPTWKSGGCPIYLVPKSLFERFDSVIREHNGWSKRELQDFEMSMYINIQTPDDAGAWVEMNIHHLKAWMNLINLIGCVRRTIHPSIFLDNPLRPYYQTTFYDPRSWSKTYKKRYTYMTSIFNTAYEFEQEHSISPYFSSSFCPSQFKQDMMEIETHCWTWNCSLDSWRGDAEWMMGRILDDYFLEGLAFSEALVGCSEQNDQEIGCDNFVIRFPHFTDVLIERYINDTNMECFDYQEYSENEILVICPANSRFGLNYYDKDGRCCMVVWGDAFMDHLILRWKEMRKAFGSLLEDWKDEGRKIRNVKFLERKGCYGNPDNMILFEEAKKYVGNADIAEDILDSEKF